MNTMELEPHIIRFEKPKPKNKLKVFFIESAKFLAIFLFFFTISGLVIMGPTIYTQINYYLTSASIAETGINMGLPVSSVDYASILPVIGERKKETRQGSHLVIPKIGVDAPIVFMESVSTKDVLEAIKEGVAHYAGTAMPGRIGNMFITGHSSFYWWNGGKYNQVFALLERLQGNDLIYVYHEGGEYVYRMTGSIVVKPTQIEVLAPTSKPTLSLMTCVPIGTNLNRLIVKAELLSAPIIDSSELSEFADIPKIPVILPLN